MADAIPANQAPDAPAVKELEAKIKEEKKKEKAEKKTTPPKEMTLEDKIKIREAQGFTYIGGGTFRKG